MRHDEPPVPPSGSPPATLVQPSNNSPCAASQKPAAACNALAGIPKVRSIGARLACSVTETRARFPPPCDYGLHQNKVGSEDVIDPAARKTDEPQIGRTSHSS